MTEEEQARRDKEKGQDDKAREEAEKATGESMRFPEGANAEACAEYFGAMDATREKYMKWDQDYS